MSNNNLNEIQNEQYRIYDLAQNIKARATPQHDENQKLINFEK